MVDAQAPIGWRGFPTDGAHASLNKELGVVPCRAHAALSKPLLSALAFGRDV
jgi:hypothetical protein